MKITNFIYDLPQVLIANYPKIPRSHCRLLSLDGNNGQLSHGVFTDLLTKLNPGDLLVLNNTRVMQARLYGKKDSGGKIEVLIDRILNHTKVLAFIKSSKNIKSGSVLFFGKNQDIKAVLLSRINELFELQFEKTTVFKVINTIGHVPLPPYINRADDNIIDREFYQTVYSLRLGAIAAPTAGLHFDNKLLSSLRLKGINIAFITLHVGAGTFQPVRTNNIFNHTMHHEYFEVSQHVINAVFECKKRGNKVIAVGTTSVRSLESAFHSLNQSVITPICGYTKLFIYPGYRYKIIDAIITNFHLPKSTLLMLVSAFSGHKYIMEAYREAILKKYDFFSYGDAMFITKNPKAYRELL